VFNTVFKKMMPILILIFSVTILSISYRFIFGIHIRHYNQYIIPCQGQRITHANYSIPITFFVLDEVDLSELSSKENILMISLKSDQGSEILATNWEIQAGAGFYSGTEFYAKRLSVYATFSESIVINKLEIVYLDKTESFDIGELAVQLMPVNNYISETQIYSTFFDLSTHDSMMNQSDDYFLSVMTVFSIQANAFSDEGYQIQRVDLGIDGLGISPSTLRIVSGTVDYGVSFTQDPDNADYINVDNVEQLPNSDILIHVGGSEAGYIQNILGLCKTNSYYESPIVTYYCPIFTCLDIETGEIYEFGDPNNVFFNAPYIINDDYVRNLIEDYGI